MGCSNGKQNGEKDNNKRRSSIKKILRFQSRRASKPARPVSYAGIDQHHRVHQTSARPLSTFDAVPFHRLETSEITLYQKMFSLLFIIKDMFNNDYDNQNRAISEMNLSSRQSSQISILTGKESNSIDLK
jgi:hypothetical protein